MGKVIEMAIKFPPTSPLTFSLEVGCFRFYAIQRHGLQMYGHLPYAFHLAVVESYLADFGFDSNDYRSAAWLHDVVEDTATTLEELARLYTPNVVSMVWACTGEGSNRKERNASIYRKLKEFPKGAPVKVADRLANVDMGMSSGNIKKLKMYVEEFEEFSKNIKPLMEDAGKDHRQLWNTLQDTMKKAELMVSLPLTTQKAA
jgi:(p)ppGpp synthase/HD superfamily hydrolase